MGYDYQTEKPKLFTERGVEMLRTVERQVDHLLETAGAFTTGNALSGVSGDSWEHLAALDYLAEKGKIVRCVREGIGESWAQYGVWASPKAHNR